MNEGRKGLCLFIGTGVIYLLSVFLAGCATTPGFKAADCSCRKYRVHTVCVCNDDAVNAYCHKHGKTWDNGKPLDDGFIRACARKGWAKRKARIWLGRSSINCIGHEECHLDYPPDVCDRDFPCFGEEERMRPDER